MCCTVFVGQSNLTNGFLNKYGSLICNQKDRRLGGRSGSRRKPRKCMPKAGQFEWSGGRVPRTRGIRRPLQATTAGQDQRSCEPGRVSCGCASHYVWCVCVCVRSDMPAYSHFKMASIFLSQQNGDCKIVLLAQLQRSVKKLLCVCEARDGCVMRYTEEKRALRVEKNKYIESVGSDLFSVS